MKPSPLFAIVALLALSACGRTQPGTAPVTDGPKTVIAALGSGAVKAGAERAVNERNEAASASLFSVVTDAKAPVAAIIADAPAEADGAPLLWTGADPPEGAALAFGIPADASSRLAARIAGTTLSAKRVLIVTTDATRAEGAAFADAFAGEERLIVADGNNVARAIAEMRDDAATVAYLAMDATAAGTFATSARAAGITAVFLGDERLGGDAFRAAAGGTVEGVVFTRLVAEDVAYDAASMFLAVAARPRGKNVTITDALRSYTGTGATGALAFDEEGRRVRGSAGIYRVKDGAPGRIGNQDWSVAP